MINPQALPASRATVSSEQSDAPGAAALLPAGYAYLASEAHYRQLAERIVACLGGAQSCVLVTGDPTANLQLTSQALRRASVGRYTVVGVASGSEIVRAQLLHATAPAAVQSGTTERADADIPPAEHPPLLFVLGEVDRLGDEQLGEICEMMLRGKRSIAGAVLLASPAMLERLQRPALAVLREALAASLRLEQLDDDEVRPFLRSQRGVDVADAALPPDTVSDIADAADGDPVLVNGIARRVLDFKATKRADPGATTATPQQPEPPTEIDALGEIARMLTEADGAGTPIPKAPAQRFDRSALREMLDELSYAVERADRDVITPAPRTEAPTADEVQVEREILAAATSAGLSVPDAPAPEGTDAVVEEAAEREPVATTEEEAPSAAAVLPVREAPAAVLEPLFLSVVPEDAADSVATAPQHIARPAALRWIAASILVVILGAALAAAALRTESHRAAAPGATIAVAQPKPAQDRPPAAASPRPSEPPRAATPVLETTSPKPAESPAPNRPGVVAVLTPAAPPPVTPTAIEKSVATQPTSASAVVPPAAVAKPAAASPAAIEAAPAERRLAPDEIAALITRGDSFLGGGDIASARLFYERAAEAGDGQAALLTGETFDPGLLARSGLHGLGGDPDKAAAWYRRAIALGTPDAEPLLKALGIR